jgi:hypothetical protein
MNKARSISHDLRPEYKRSDFKRLERGRYYERVKATSNVVVFDADFAAVFPNSPVVNKGLHSLVEVTENVSALTSGSGHSARLRRRTFRVFLPQSISGLWKADLFTGNPDTDKWVGTTLKINRTQLEGGKGLRLGIIPANEGESDAIVKDESKNLVVCPLPYDRSFMQAFYQAWRSSCSSLLQTPAFPKKRACLRLPRDRSQDTWKTAEIFP